MKCFGFDTSNYTTSVACFSDSGSKNCGKLLPVPKGAKGLRQSDALFHHTRALPELFRELTDSVGGGCNAVSVSYAPRRAEGSYMPCFLAGASAAEVLARGCDVPLYRFSHQEGHLAAAAYSSGAMDMLSSPFLAWHLSGGTTELLYCNPLGEYTFETKIIGGTLDISAGQCVDRAGVRLGLGFPCGQSLEKLSLSGRADQKYNPKPDGLYFNLSGMENRFGRMAELHTPPEDIAAYVLSSLEELLVKVTKKALCEYPELPVLCSGGVMSCISLQNRMIREFNAKVACPGLSRDNALGIALLGYCKGGGKL